MGLLLFVIFSILAFSPIHLSAEDKKELSEVQKLKAENFQLRVQVAQLTATLQDRENRIKSAELTDEQSKLVEEFKKALKAKDNEVFDWPTLSFKLPNKK